MQKLRDEARTKASTAPRGTRKPGSPEWCYQTMNLMKRSFESLHLDHERFEGYLAELRQHQAWKKVPIGKPYGSEDRMLAAELGKRADEIREQLRDIKRKQVEAQNRAADQEDRENPSRQGQRTDLLYNNENNVQEVNGAPTGNSASAALRRLRKNRPDIHARVLSGEMSPHAGMIESGFRKKVERPKLSRFDQIVKWLPSLTTAEQRKLERKLKEMLE